MRKYEAEATARQIDRSVWMTQSEAAALLGLQHSDIRPLIDRGSLKSLRRGHWWYVDRKSAQALKDKRER